MLPLLITGNTLASRQSHLHQLVGNTLVVFELDTQNTKEPLKAVKELNHFLSLSQNEPVYHLVIEAQNLSIPAQNALLKALEELSVNHRVIITADSSKSILPTILSRVQLIKLDQKYTELSNSKELLGDIFGPDHTKLATIASSWAKDEPEEKLNQLLETFHTYAKKQPTIARAKGIELIFDAINDLTLNIPYDMVILNLFLKLRSLKG